MRILSRHFLASYLTLYLAVLAASTLAIIIVEMMLNSEAILSYGDGAAGVASYLFLKLPASYLPFIVPIASFTAAFLCLGLAARSLEIVACKAGGISPLRVALPVLLAATVLSGLMLVLNETIVLDASREFNRIDSGGEDRPLLRAGSFWYHRGNTFYNVLEADRANRTVYGVRVYERGPEGRLVRSLEARSARIDAENRWHLEDATIRSFDPESPSSAPETTHEQSTMISAGSERDLALLEADAHNLSLLRLRDFIDAVASEGRNPTRYRALFHARLAEPLTVLLFTLIGVPLGLAVERSRSLAVAALQGIVVIGIFYAVQTTSTLVATGGVSSAVLMPWVTLAAFAAWGAWRLHRVPV